MKKNTTLYDMICEMQTWCSFSNEVLEKAKASKITTSNNRDLKYYLDGWVNGRYDEDPELLGQGLTRLAEL